MPPEAIPRPESAPPDAPVETDEIRELREEVVRLKRIQAEATEIINAMAEAASANPPGIHQAICQALDRILPAGSKTKTLGVALAALVAGGPHAAAGTLPIPQEWQDWLFHFWTTNPNKFTIAAGVLGYLLWASYDARKYREEKSDAS